MFESEEIRLLPTELQWRTVVPKQGESVKGWLIGPLQVFTCHYHSNASRPCRDKITKGGMLCYCSKTPTSSRQIGYQPLLTRDREKLVVLMCATTAKKVKMYAHGLPVEFWRPNKEKTPLCVKQILAEDLGTQASANIHAIKPHDIKPYLLNVLWQDTALLTYFSKSPSSSDPMCTTPKNRSTKTPKLGAASAARDNALSLVTQLATGMEVPQ